MGEFGEIRGARENNLKDAPLRIPKRKIRIFTEVSGSGKSSLGVNTIASDGVAESLTGRYLGNRERALARAPRFPGNGQWSLGRLR